MEELSKTQIVLVTLLLSFVTSIATGILTFALMDQAPASVTRTINHVVERTIEKVSSAETEGQTASVVTKETIVVKEDEQAIEAIAKNTPALVRIIGSENIYEPASFRTLGLVVTKNRFILADKDAITDGGVYKLEVGDKTVPLSLIARNEKVGVAIFAVQEVASSTPITLPYISLAASHLNLGQSVIVLGGKEVNAVALGTVTSIEEDGQVIASTATSSPIENKKIPLTTLRISADTRDIVPGALLLNLSGEIVGMHVKHGIYDKNIFLGAGVLSQLISILVK